MRTFHRNGVNYDIKGADTICNCTERTKFEKNSQKSIYVLSGRARHENHFQILFYYNFLSPRKQVETVDNFKNLKAEN